VLAFGFSIAIFLACFSVGFPLLPRKPINDDKYLNLLLSPVVGLGVLIIILNALSRLGFSIKNVAWPLLGLVGISLLVTLWQHRKREHLARSSALLILSLPVAALFGGWPILRYGFNWLSFASDDMNLYVLGATRFYNQGFYGRVTSLFFAGTDYSQSFRHFYVALGSRPGSELFLAFTSSFRGGKPIEIFMPTILALQIMLIASTLALVRISVGKKRWQMITALLLATILPLMNLGFLYQLIGQVGGLSFGIGLIAMSTILLKSKSQQGNIRLYVLFSLLLSGQLIWYPELLPFIGLPIFLSFLFTKRANLERLWIGSVSSILLSIVILNKYFFQAIFYSYSQVSSTTNAYQSNKLVFPYFLKPEGLAAVFGFSPLNRQHSQTLEIFFVGMSFFLLAFLAAAVFFKPRVYLPSEIASLLMLIVFLYLIYSNNGFGSYKMTMYLQPLYVCSCLTILEKSENFRFRLKMSRSRLLKLSAFTVALLTPLIVETSQFYSNASTGTKNNGFSEIHNVSSSKVAELIVKAEKKYDPSMGPLISPTGQLSLVHLEAEVSKGVPMAFLSRNPGFDSFSSTHEVDSVITRQNVSFPDGLESNKFQQLKLLSNHPIQRAWYLLANDAFSSLNKSSFRGNGQPWNYQLVQNPRNYLVFVNSIKAPIYDDFTSVEPSAFFPEEPNPMIPGTYTQSVGDTLLLQVINFQPGSRLNLNLSSTILSQYFRRIPNIRVIGSSTITQHPVGGGSARLSFEGISPLEINHQNYFEIKFDQKLKGFPSSSNVLSKLYGSQVNLDSRKISSFVSDLSLVDPASSLPRNLPSHVGSFPRDLQNSELNYSGAYEDGWMSPSFYFDLKSKGSDIVNISGFVPLVGTNKSFKSTVTAYINGVAAKNFTLGIGNFNQDIRSKVKLVPGTVSRVEFRFKDAQILPEPDGRPASIFLTNLGFK
jgi:hypothetical protein